MWLKQKELQTIFSIGQTTCSKVCRCIDKHPDRYGEFGKDGIRYGLLAFADANKYRQRLDRGEEVPPFDPEEISRHLFPKPDEKMRFIKAGQKFMRDRIFDDVDGYFNDTQFPNDISPNLLARIIRKAILSIILTAEVDE